MTRAMRRFGTRRSRLRCELAPRPWVAACLAAITVVLVFAARSSAQCEPHWVETSSYPGVNGTVYSAAELPPSKTSLIVLNQASSSSTAGM